MLLLLVWRQLMQWHSLHLSTILLLRMSQLCQLLLLLLLLLTELLLPFQLLLQLALLYGKLSRCQPGLPRV